ncbi:MAG: hypothetical protein JXD18_12740 [Anaerolineae bacterium]|nr:hypothetical protein [Anaerolineae bacterium]
MADLTLQARQPRQNRKILFVLLALVVVLSCCSGCLAALVLSGRVAPSAGTAGLSVHVCGGLATVPRWQVGVAWYSPLSSYRGPLGFSPYAVCVDVPVSAMPTSLWREWVFPP